MTNYLPTDSSSSYNVGSVLYSPSATVGAPSAKKWGSGASPSDALTQAEQSAKSATPQGRPTLPQPSPQLPANDMMIIAAAFCKAYSAMNNGIMTEVKDYANLQTLDQTQSASILRSTTIAMNKQLTAEKAAAAISKEMKSAAATGSTLSWIVQGVGIVIIAATVISAVFDFGASLAAVPEEAAALGAATAAETGTDAAADAGADAGEEAAAEEGSATGADATAGGQNTSVTQEQGGAQTQTQNDVAKSDAENAQSKTNWKAKLGKIAGSLGVSALLGSPSLVKGIMQLEVAGKMVELAAAQKIVGQAFDVQTRNNMYFQFLQQMLQREGGVLTQEVNDAGEVIQTFSSVVSALRGISFGLASAA